MMEACKIVEEELDKFDEKLLAMKTYLEKITDYLISSVDQLRSLYSDVDQDYLARTGAGGTGILLSECMKDINAVLGAAQKNHREIHSTVSKVGKAIDKCFTTELGPESAGGIFGGEDGLQKLTTAVAHHLYHEGLTEIGDKLLEEPVFKEKPSTPREPYAQIHAILNALKKKDLEPALNWVNQNRTELDKMGSALEFKLRRIEFINVVKTGTEFNPEALQHAREHLSRFVDRHQKDIQNLMGCLMFSPSSVGSSPYSYFFDESMWDETVESFRADSFTLYGLPLKSPLAVAFDAGCSAVPQVLNIAKAMQQPLSLKGYWSGKEELPIDVSAGKGFCYHSVFVCPILKEPTSEANPPVRLVCGHVISQQALDRLGTGRLVLKCPYCPALSDPKVVKVITF